MCCVLVVDDELCIREALESLLSPPYCIHGAADGREALALVEAYPIAAVILDVVLRDEDGLALVEPLRTHSLAPILVLTGHSTDELVIRALRSNVADFLRKPINPAELQERLARVLPPTAGPHGAVDRARRYIETHADHPDCLAALPRIAGLSERHLRREFRRVYGRSPRWCLIACRLDRTAELLRRTDLDVKQVAHRAGFGSLATFERCFRRRFGMSPLAFRHHTALA